MFTWWHKHVPTNKFANMGQFGNFSALCQRSNLRGEELDRSRRHQRILIFSSLPIISMGFAKRYLPGSQNCNYGIFSRRYSQWDCSNRCDLSSLENAAAQGSSGKKVHRRIVETRNLIDIEQGIPNMPNWVPVNEFDGGCFRKE